MRILAAFFLLAAGSGLSAAAAQDFTTRSVDETPEARGMEEAAAHYFAPPPTEEAAPVVNLETLDGASTVAIAIALGKVERGLDACRVLRRDMQALIGDRKGGYSVNAGWLKRYQSCLLRRAEETKVLGRAISARQKELIAQMGRGDEEGEQALKAADLMSRLAARQSDVALAVRQEAQMQKAFVRYYNTGKMPAVLRGEEVAGSQDDSFRMDASPAGTDAPRDMQYGPVERIGGEDAPAEGETRDTPMAGPEDDAARREVPAVTPQDSGATGAPMPLRGEGEGGGQ